MFPQEQSDFFAHLSGFLPLVRPHEYEIIRCLLKGVEHTEEIDRVLEEKIPGYERKQLIHALQFLKVVQQNGEKVSLIVFKENGNGTYLFDVVMEYALPDYLQYDFGLTKD